jgi:hypothetical protein
MLATESVEQAFLQLTFAIKLLTYIELGRIQKAEFDGDVLILLKRRNLRFREQTFRSDNDLVSAAQNNYTLTLGFTSIVLESAMTAAGMPADLPTSSPHRDLRALVYMIRCAFAHDMMHPRWEARGPFARVLDVDLPSERLRVEVEALNGQPFDPIQIGGIEAYFEIKDAVITLVEHSAGFASGKEG